MLQRVRWGAIGTLLLMVLAITATATEERDLGVVLGLCAIAMAVLSLLERS